MRRVLASWGATILLSATSLGAATHARADRLAAGADATATTAPTAAAPAAPPRKPRKVIVEPPPPVPDPAARQQALESNLENNSPRQGLVFGATLMGWQQLSTFDGAAGTGGLILRLGAVATPSTVALIEAMVMAFPPGSGDSYIASSQSLSLVALTYVAPTLWLRGGAGYAGFAHAIEDKSNPDTFYSLSVRSGLGFTFGAGVDVVQWRGTRLTLEATAATHRFAQGWIANLGIGLGLTVY